MPNICENRLEASGPATAVATFVKAIKDHAAQQKATYDPATYTNTDPFAHHSLCRTFLPPPPELADPDPRFLSDADYAWRRIHWGTKWGDYDHSSFTHTATGETATLHTDFDSAWGPPLQALYRLGEMFPTLTFDLTYKEPGMCFKGQLRIVEGVTVTDTCENYDPAEDEEEEDTPADGAPAEAITAPPFTIESLL
jgi:hypothetical protein